MLATPLFAKLHGTVDPRPGAGARERLKRLFGDLLESDDRVAQRIVCRLILEFEARRQLRAFGYAVGVGARRSEVRRLMEEYLGEVLGEETET